MNQFLISNQAVTLTNWDTANKEIREVAVDNPIYQNVFAKDPDDVLWPNLSGSYQFKNGSVYRDDLMKTSGGYAAFVHQEVSNGHLFIASFVIIFFLFVLAVITFICFLKIVGFKKI